MILVLGIIGVAVGLGTIAYAYFSTRSDLDLLDYNEDGRGEREDAP